MWWVERLRVWRVLWVSLIGSVLRGVVSLHFYGVEACYVDRIDGIDENDKVPSEAVEISVEIRGWSMDDNAECMNREEMENGIFGDYKILSFNTCESILLKVPRIP